MKIQKLPGIFLLLLFATSVCSAQRAANFRNEAENVALAYRMIKYGYENKQPVVIASAVMVLSEHPVAGTFQANVVSPGPDIIRVVTDSGMITKNLKTLLDDAAAMAGSDSITLSVIYRVEQMLAGDTQKDRGRKYSPFVQEYSIKPNSSVVLTATFNGNEPAEVFVVPYHLAQLDLYIYNEKGKLVVSDKNRTDNCYTTFTPVSTAVYKIEVRNRSASDNDCLLMTN